MKYNLSKKDVLAICVIIAIAAVIFFGLLHMSTDNNFTAKTFGQKWDYPNTSYRAGGIYGYKVDEKRYFIGYNSLLILPVGEDRVAFHNRFSHNKEVQSLIKMNNGDLDGVIDMVIAETSKEIVRTACKGLIQSGAVKDNISLKTKMKLTIKETVLKGCTMELNINSLEEIKPKAPEV